MKRYPHILTYTPAIEATKDGAGNWIPSDPKDEVIAPCREEANSRGSLVVLTDGKEYRYMSVIYLPSESVENIQPGQLITVTDAAGRIRSTGMVIRVDFDRFHTRLWL